MDFKVKINNFEGPIDALLQMIEKRKMPINDVSLTQVTDEYIQFVSGLGGQSFSNLTHFIFVASTLTLIKSKSLLPKLELSHEEQGDIEELKQRIALFKEYQSIAFNLKENFSQKKFFYSAKPAKRTVVFSPGEEVKVANLGLALEGVFSEVVESPKTKKEASIRIAVHIEEMMDSLHQRIEKQIQANFRDFIKATTPESSYANKKERKVYEVVGFLAMLELVKNGMLHVLQLQNFEQINIEKI